MQIPWRTLRRLTVAIFNSRRKSVRNALKGLLEKEEVLPFLEEAGINPELRGQDIPPAQFLCMAQILESRRQEFSDTPPELTDSEEMS